MAKQLLCSINIKRPCWDSVKKAYNEINEANPNDKSLQEKFKQGIIAEGKYRGKSEAFSINIAENVIRNIQNGLYNDKVWQRYALVGGYIGKQGGIFGVLGEYIRHKDFFGKSPNYADFSNTCALQISYALNYGGMPIKNKIEYKEYNSNYGNNLEHIYITGVVSIINFLQS